MKKLMIATALLTLLTVSSVQAMDWIDNPSKTKLGAVYAATCNACLSGSYNNDTGYWACTDAPQDGNTPCWDAIKQAIANSGEYGDQ